MPRSQPSSPRLDPVQDELESRPLFIAIEALGPASPVQGTNRPGTEQVAARIDGVAWHRKVFTMTDALKWGSLFALVVQNSALFVITRYTRSEVKGHLYLSSVVVLLIELAKMGVCLLLLLREARWRPCVLLSNLYSNLWEQRSTTLLLAVPATCYAIQNNLIFVALSHLSAAAAQVLYQLKSLSTAFFTVVLLHRSFSPVQWLSFVLLTGGVILVQSQDAKSSSSPTGASPLLGVCAALAAATLSGFAGVFLEKMFTSGSTSLWMRNVQLALFAIPLQAIAVWQMDGRHVERHGLLQGFHASTWLLVLVQLVGALCTAVVIKFAGNVLKTFATVLALLCTCGWSIVSLRIIYCICATASLSRAPLSPSLARPSLPLSRATVSLPRAPPSLSRPPSTPTDKRNHAYEHTPCSPAACNTHTHARCTRSSPGCPPTPSCCAISGLARSSSSTSTRRPCSASAWASSPSPSGSTRAPTRLRTGRCKRSAASRRSAWSTPPARHREHHPRPWWRSSHPPPRPATGRPRIAPGWHRRLELSFVRTSTRTRTCNAHYQPCAYAIEAWCVYHTIRVRVQYEYNELFGVEWTWSLPVGCVSYCRPFVPSLSGLLSRSVLALRLLLFFLSWLGGRAVLLSVSSLMCLWSLSCKVHVVPSPIEARPRDTRAYVFGCCLRFSVRSGRL